MVDVNTNWCEIGLVATFASVVLAGATAARTQTDAGGSGSAGAAKPAEESAVRGDRLQFRTDAFEVQFDRPEGWRTEDPGPGAVATLEAASDRTAEIEVRVSPSVPGKKKAAFFNSYHSRLKSAGFVEATEPAEKTFGGQKGWSVEYRGNSDRGEFRLAVWHFYRDGAAWIVTGFFPTERRGLHYDAYLTVIESLSVRPVTADD